VAHGGDRAVPLDGEALDGALRFEQARQVTRDAHPDESRVARCRIPLLLHHAHELPVVELPGQRRGHLEELADLRLVVRENNRAREQHAHDPTHAAILERDGPALTGSVLHA
jgi:hypothetical protein